MKHVEQLTKEQAVRIYESGIWKDMTARQIVEMQLPQSKLCVPFSTFQASLQEVLGRLVYTHEFAGDEGQERLYNEVFNGAEPPTLEQIIALIPGDVVLIDNE